MILECKAILLLLLGPCVDDEGCVNGDENGVDVNGDGCGMGAVVAVVVAIKASQGLTAIPADVATTQETAMPLENKVRGQHLSRLLAGWAMGLWKAVRL